MQKQEFIARAYSDEQSMVSDLITYFNEDYLPWKIFTWEHYIIVVFVERSIQNYVW